MTSSSARKWTNEWGVRRGVNLYESRLKGKLHVISKRYTQRIERHNLNLRQHLARLGRKSLSFSKSVELHDKVIGHYLNIKHYQ
ncbi:Transposase [Shigella dysenteriae 1617]|uniref:Transposase n=1 Tax=Shigella dysenteriae 1617 TaxID=754093 RepID=A0A0A6ZLH7_SHIDY|nr:Transposase [Shigella dysenteriae 1617]AHA67977.1 Transposase [Shigella dysenteriae 1617]